MDNNAIEAKWGKLMARKTNETQVEQHIVTEDDAQGLPAMLVETQQLTIAQAAVIDNFDVIKAIGQIESTIFMRQVADKLIAEIAINVREGKKYKGLPYKDENGKVATVADFSEFCQVFLGKSYRRTKELIDNYNQLGPELYEQAERIGFRQRDYNALKALPIDDRQLIAQAIEEEDLDKALDIMQEMAAKHQREKEQLTRQAADLTETLNAKDKVIKDKSAHIAEQAEKLAVLENKQRQQDSQPVSAEQRLLDLRSNLQITAANIKTHVMTRLRKDIKALYEAEMEGNDETLFMAGCLIEIGRELAILRDEYNLPATVTEDPTPEWLREDVMQHIDEQYAGLPSVGEALINEG
jgi:hypothetical protein